MRIKEVMRVTGLSRTTIYRKIKDKTFPAPYQLSEDISGWSSLEIAEWQEGIIRAAKR